MFPIATINVNLPTDVLEAGKVSAQPLANGPWEILYGFVFVVLVLVIFSLLTSLIGQLFIHQKKIHAVLHSKLSNVLPVSFVDAVVGKLPVSLGSLSATSASDRESVPPEIIAVIAAAIHTTMPVQTKVVSIRQAKTTSGWSTEGRREIFSSHRFR